MGVILEQRRRDTDSRLEQLRSNLDEAERRMAGGACVYVTGSGGRGELRRDSDLDVFIVSGAKPKLSRLDSIVVKADLIRANETLQFPPFSKDGKYLEVYTVEQLCENLGRPEDDYANTFTARLLLLLESRPLLGADCYRSAINDIIAEYWKDFPDHAAGFRPIYLINDILRLWKTLCVNYEAFTVREPSVKLAERKLKNYKLKNSRVLTCYSALLYLMQVFAERRTVTIEHAKEMVALSPTQRFEWIAARSGFAHSGQVARLLQHYEQFLESTAQPERDMIEIFADDERRKQLTRDANQVGNQVADLLQKLGADNELYRYILV